MVARTKKCPEAEGVDSRWQKAVREVPSTSKEEGKIAPQVPIDPEDDMGLEELMKMLGEEKGAETQEIPLDELDEEEVEEQEPQTPKKGVSMAENTPLNGTPGNSVSVSLSEMIDLFIKRGSEIDREIEQVRQRLVELLEEKKMHGEVGKMAMQKLGGIIQPQTKGV